MVKIANDFKEEYGYVTKTCTVYGYPSSVINWRICDDSDEKICQNPTDLSVVSSSPLILDCTTVFNYCHFYLRFCKKFTFFEGHNKKEYFRTNINRKIQTD